MKTKVQQFMEGHGVVRMWSTCPSINLLDLLLQQATNSDPNSTPIQTNEPVEILCVAPGDIGSVLMTMCRLRRQKLDSEVGLVKFGRR